MKGTQLINRKHFYVKVAHDRQRQIMEIPSLIRVMNNYYYKKHDLQDQIKPILLHKFKEGLKLLESNRDWLHSIPSALVALNEDFTTKKDSFKFPDGIILFEAWMNLGFEALYPKLVLHYRFPGILEGEKTRNLYQFIFSTSRGFGFPIYFNPDFYKYDFSLKSVLEFFFKWLYTICHRANQAILLVSNRLNIKRHHPGEFESVIISEYEDKIYKGIDTLLHGYFTQEPKKIGNYNSLRDVLDKITFTYSIGDHAMSIDTSTPQKFKLIPVIDHDLIKKSYNIDFYEYISKLLHFRSILTRILKQILLKKKKIVKKMKLKEKFFFSINHLFRFFHLKKSLNHNHFHLHDLECSIELIKNLLKMIWITPLYTHTIHKPIKQELKYAQSLSEIKEETIDSIFHLYVTYFQIKKGFKFEEPAITESIDNLRDEMAKIWLYFKERQLNFAYRKLTEISTISHNNNYKEIINNYVNELIPIFSIYEILHRPLAESIYPEASLQSRKLGSFIAGFLTSKYNPFGVNLMKLFNKLAYQNWSLLISKKKWNLQDFFAFIIRLPIWKYIPDDMKKENITENKLKF